MRNHNTLTRAKIIEEVAKCVPATCKVDLEDPEVFILMEIFKVRPFLSRALNQFKCLRYRASVVLV